ncbi:hypothetical protein RJ641_027184, partial [Dillenia turbinata]
RGIDKRMYNGVLYSTFGRAVSSSIAHSDMIFLPVSKLLELVELKLKEKILREPTLLVMLVCVPNVGKSALINSIHQMASSHFPGEDKVSYSWTIAWYYSRYCWVQVCICADSQIAHQPSIYVQDTPGVLIPCIPDIEMGLNHALVVLKSRSTPLHWKRLNSRMIERNKYELEAKHEFCVKDLLPKKKKLPNMSDDIVMEVQCALHVTKSEFDGDLEDENNSEGLIELQFETLQKAFRVPHKASEAQDNGIKEVSYTFRTGKLGPFILDDLKVLVASDVRKPIRKRYGKSTMRKPAGLQYRSIKSGPVIPSGNPGKFSTSVVIISCPPGTPPT